jgi:uncharacterized membrane protein
MAQFRIRTIQIKGWQVFLIFALVLALLATLLVVALGAFLILFPIFVVAGALAYLFGFGRRRAPGRDGRGQTIETEYRVIEPEKKSIERDKKR